MPRGVWVMGSLGGTDGNMRAQKVVGSSHKGGLVKGGLAMYGFPLCNCNTSGSDVNAEIENMPNCQTAFF